MIGLPVFAGTPEKGIGLTYFTGSNNGIFNWFFIGAFLLVYLNIKGIINTFLKFIFQ